MEATIGGVWVREDGPAIAFSTNPVIPAWARGLIHIGVLELIAVDVANRVFTALSDFWNIFHVDNSGGVFNLTSGKSNCLLSQVVVEETISGMQKSETAGYFAYLRTDRNPGDCTTRMEKLPLLLEAFNPVMLVPGSKVLESSALTGIYDPEFLTAGVDFAPWERYRELFNMMTSMDWESGAWLEMSARAPRARSLWNEAPSPEAKLRRVERE